MQRSAKECEIRWLGDRHPQFNHVQWSQAEIARVRELVVGMSEGQVDWTEIAATLGVRLDLISEALSLKQYFLRQGVHQLIVCDMLSSGKLIHGMNRPISDS